MQVTGISKHHGAQRVLCVVPTPSTRTPASSIVSLCRFLTRRVCGLPRFTLALGCSQSNKDAAPQAPRVIQGSTRTAAR
eukprot:5088393-Lingulodinium_polyedra.AAC.1